MAQFTNYFQNAEAPWRELLFDRARWNPQEPHTIVEVGSYEGSSAWWMLTHLLKSPDSRLHCIDAWPGEEGEARHRLFLDNMAEHPRRAHITVHKDWSQNALRKLLAEGVQADLLYIDGGHDAPTVLRDLVTGFDLVKTGGLIICDDYLWDDPAHGGHHVLGRPKIAIDAFTTIYSDKLRVVRGLNNLQLYALKTAD